MELKVIWTDPALGSKNRVGNFFGRVGDRVGSDRPATRNRIGKKQPTLTIIVSGRPVWPSRDPIEEHAFNFNYLKFWQSVVSGLPVEDSIGIPFTKTFENGTHLYRFVRNTPVAIIDYVGLFCFSIGRITEQLACGGSSPAWHTGSWFEVVGTPSVGPSVAGCSLGCTSWMQLREQRQMMRTRSADARQCWTPFTGSYTEYTNISYSSCAMTTIAGSNQFRDKITCLHPSVSPLGGGPSAWQQF
jgi:hypothetical protein